MKIEESQHLFEIHIEELNTWRERPHKHNFFELVYIEEGNGTQCINEHEFAYAPGNIFLLPPLDCHSFVIAQATRFYFIRFTNHYFMGGHQLANYQSWFDKMAYVLANYNKVPGDIIGSDSERQFIIQTIKSIHREYLNEDAYSHSIISGAMASILNILARSIEQRYVEHGNQSDQKFGEILRHINTHITEPDELSIPAMAEQFGVAASYFSEYFKKTAQMTLGDYIMKSKLKLVETKVLHTDLTLKEIAYQLNFADSSHLARSFKKAYGMTVKEFKTSGQLCCA